MNRCFFLFFIILNSCSTEVEDSGILQITVATGDCMESCPKTVSKFDNNLNMYYYSEIPIDGINQYYYGKISDTSWNKLNFLIKKIAFNKLDSIIQGADGRDLEIIAYLPERKRIIGFGGSLPDSSANALEEIAQVYKNIKLKPIPKYHFETIVQNPPPPPPKLEDILKDL